MLKGFIVLMLVGATFSYFVFNVVGKVERNDSDHYVSQDERKAKEWARYYMEDALGEPVLSFGNTPIKRADAVWKESQMRQEMLEKFPDFEEIRQFVHDRLQPSLFRKYLLEKIDRIESDYMEGKIDSVKAKSELSNL